MYLMVGLGNPQKKCQITRHNAGFLLCDWLTKSRKMADSNWIIAKTKDVSMNDSGKYVSRELRRRGTSPDRLILVHDDLDLGLGEYKVQFGRGSAGHKGVASVIDALGTKDFWRIRIGIGRPQPGSESDNYVLQNFTPDELETVKSLSGEIEEQAISIITDNL